jgi:hypothetical protein
MDAGRYIPPPPDYEAMLRAMREEVATTFVTDDDAKGKGKRGGKGAAVEATASAEDSPDVDEDGATDE